LEQYERERTTHDQRYLVVLKSLHSFSIRIEMITTSERLILMNFISIFWGENVYLYRSFMKSSFQERFSMSTRNNRFQLPFKHCSPIPIRNCFDHFRQSTIQSAIYFGDFIDDLNHLKVIEKMNSSVIYVVSREDVDIQLITLFDMSKMDVIKTDHHINLKSRMRKLSTKQFSQPKWFYSFSQIESISFNWRSSFETNIIQFTNPIKSRKNGRSNILVHKNISQRTNQNVWLVDHLSWWSYNKSEATLHWCNHTFDIP
jgi:hypothetical protein